MNIFKRIYRKLFRITFASSILSIQKEFLKAKKKSIKLGEEMMNEKQLKLDKINNIQNDIKYIETQMEINSKFIENLSKLIQ